MRKEIIDTLSDLTDVVVEITEALKVVLKEKYPKANYPYGCCAKASYVIYYILKNYFYCHAIFQISGELKREIIGDFDKCSTVSHTFLFINGYIVDTTIWQFNNKYNFEFPEVYISDSFEEYNKIFDYNVIIEIDYDNDKVHSELLKEVVAELGLSAFESSIVYLNQDLGD